MQENIQQAWAALPDWQYPIAFVAGLVALACTASGLLMQMDQPMSCRERLAMAGFGGLAFGLALFEPQFLVTTVLALAAAVVIGYIACLAWGAAVGRTSVPTPGDVVSDIREFREARRAEASNRSLSRAVPAPDDDRGLSKADRP